MWLNNASADFVHFIGVVGCAAAVVVVGGGEVAAVREDIFN